MTPNLDRGDIVNRLSEMTDEQIECRTDNHWWARTGNVFVDGTGRRKTYGTELACGRGCGVTWIKVRDHEGYRRPDLDSRTYPKDYLISGIGARTRDVRALENMEMMRRMGVL